MTTDIGISKSTFFRWIKEAQTKKSDDDSCTATNCYMPNQKYEKLKNIVEILQKVDCKPADPLSVNLKEKQISRKALYINE